MYGLDWGSATKVFLLHIGGISKTSLRDWMPFFLSFFLSQTRGKELFGLAFSITYNIHILHTTYYILILHTTYSYYILYTIYYILHTYILTLSLALSLSHSPTLTHSHTRLT